MASQINEEFSKLSLNTPVEDYNKLMNDEIKLKTFQSEDLLNESWSRISAAARNTIWKLLFDNHNPTDKEQLEKAAELLKTHKRDCCIYQSEEYNKWIVRVRDELLKRNMLEFWKNEIVQNELGLCWARDSKLFHNNEDPEPAYFYDYAECKAPWLDQHPTVGLASDLLSSLADNMEKTLKKISMHTPIEDYNYNLDAQYYIDDDDSDAYDAIFEEARNIIWQLLFADPELSSENSKKAADFLEEYKNDACNCNPLDYNDWIPKVRDELLKRKYFYFWQEIIVKKQLGLCWAGDSDYFRDLLDTKHEEFYKVGEDFINQHKK